MFCDDGSIEKVQPAPAPSSLIVNPIPAMVTIVLRAAGSLFGATCSVTTPLPDPDPETTVTQGVLLVVFQSQWFPATTPTVAVPPLGPNDTLLLIRAKLQVGVMLNARQAENSDELPTGSVASEFMNPDDGVPGASEKVAEYVASPVSPVVTLVEPNFCGSAPNSSWPDPWQSEPR